MKKREWYTEVICLVLFMVFLFVGLDKILDFRRFQWAIETSPPIRQLAVWLPYSMVTIEIVIAVALIVPRWRLLGLYASFSLLAIFSAYIIFVILMCTYLPPSCGGVLPKITWTQQLALNFLLLAFSYWGLISYNRMQADNR